MVVSYFCSSVLRLLRDGACGWFLLAALSCAPQPVSEAVVPRDRGAPVAFSFRGTGDVVFDSEGTRGRATIVALVTTYDMASQLLLRRIEEVVRTHRPRANAGAVVMEPRKYEVLLDTYKEALELSFPVVLADLATREGRGPFGEVEYLPLMVVLDEKGRVVARHVGQVEPDVIAEALAEASPEGRGER